jgi:hypothetical protein
MAAPILKKLIPLAANLGKTLLSSGGNLKTLIADAREKKQWLKLIFWCVLALSMVMAVIAFLFGSIDMEQLKELIRMLTETFEVTPVTS